MRKLTCLRCGGDMNYISREKFQLGQTGWVLGDLPNLFAGAMELDVYSCPRCGKVEFYQVQEAENHDELLQKQCPQCGRMHDFDYPKCPFCKYDYNEKRRQNR